MAVTHRGAAAGEAWGWSCRGLTRPSVGAGLALAGVQLLFTPLACGGGGTRRHCFGTASFWLIPGRQPSASCTGTGTLAVFSGDKMTSCLVGGDYRGFHGQLSCAPPHPPPHPCARADTGSRRRWPEGGRLQCLSGGRAGPDTRPHPPRSAAPRSLGGRRSGSLRVWGCRSPGCDRAGTDKRRIPLSSSVLRSPGRTAGEAGQRNQEGAPPGCRARSSGQPARRFRLRSHQPSPRAARPIQHTAHVIL